MNDNNDTASSSDLEDAATGEHPVLLGALSDDQPTTEVPAVAAASRSDAPEQGAQVALGLAHLESEIASLHERWQQIEQQFNAKDSLVASLRGEIQAREAAAAELDTRLAKSTEDLRAVTATLANRQQDIASLTDELDTRRAELAKRAAELEAVAAERSAAQRDVDTARAEIALLGSTLERERTAAETAAKLNHELMKGQGTLNLRVQELEAYIDGRASSWSALHNEITAHKNTILRLEKDLKAQERLADEAEQQKRAIAHSLDELKERNAELVAQGKTSEAAYKHLEHRLEDVRAAHAWLQSDVARHRAEHQRLLAKENDDRQQIATLEAELAQRGDVLATIEQQLSAARTRNGELDAAKASLTERLEQQTALAAQLAAEVSQKQAGLDLLNRSVQRLSNLGASVAELERRFDFDSKAPVTSAAPARAAAGESEVDELLPAETFLGPELESELVGASAQRTNGGVRKFIGMIGGEAVDYALAKSEVTIGRGKASDIRIQSHYISRHHARISTRGIATTIEDVGSKNGILVNHEKVKRAVLRDGDVVTLASELELKFIDARH